VDTVILTLTDAEEYKEREHRFNVWHWDLQTEMLEAFQFYISWLVRNIFLISLTGNTFQRKSVASINKSY
jgi:hypothetical protein